MANIIVIGGSAGVDPLRTIIQPMPRDLQAAIFIVMHLSPLAPSVLPEILQRATIDLVTVQDGQAVKPRRVYVARGHHLLVDPGQVRLTRVVQKRIGTGRDRCAFFDDARKSSGHSCR